MLESLGPKPAEVNLDPIIRQVQNAYEWHISVVGTMIFIVILLYLNFYFLVSAWTKKVEERKKKRNPYSHRYEEVQNQLPTRGEDAKSRDPYR